MVSAIQAVFEVVHGHLSGASAYWDDRVRPNEQVEPTLAKPYVCFFLVDEFREASAPARNIRRVVITVKGVVGGEDASDPLGTAVAIQEALSGLLEDSGASDYAPKLPSHPEWVIQNVYEGRAVWIPDREADTLKAYHAGHQYEFLCERV